MGGSLDLDRLLLLDLDLLEGLFSLVRGDLKLFLDGCCCWEESVGGIGGLAFTGVLIGVVVGTVVEGFGEMEVGVELIVLEESCVGRDNVDFSEAAIDSIPFSILFSEVAHPNVVPKLEGPGSKGWQKEFAHLVLEV